MKILLSALVLSCFGAYASEVSKQDFLSLIKANKAVLEKLEVGMTSKKVELIDHTAYECDQGNCKEISCKHEVTTQSTIVSIYEKKHYVHVKKSTINLTGAPECAINENEIYLELKDNKIFDHSNQSDFDNITKIEKVSNDIYKIYSLDEKWGRINFTIDTTQSAFYYPLSTNVPTLSFIMNTTIEGYTDPKLLDLTSIKLCHDYPLANNNYGQTCSEKSNYTEILK